MLNGQNALGGTETILMRVVGVNQVLVNVASTGSITRRRTVGSPPSILEAGTTLTPINDYVFDVPQTDEGWNFAQGGYNFRDRVPCDAVGPMTVTYTFVDINGFPSVQKEFISVASVP
jgi:hypothetical protein